MAADAISRKAKKHKIALTVVTRIVLILFTVVVLWPILWTIFTSFKTSSEFLTSAWSLPSSLHVQNYANAWQTGNLGANFINSIIVTALGLAFIMVLAVPLAYATSRMKFKLRGPVNFVIMAGLFISQTYIAVPVFTMLSRVEQSINNYFADYIFFGSYQIHIQLTSNLVIYALICAVTSLPFTVYLLRGYMSGIPKDYEEAAGIDGCGHWATMLRVIVPMSKSALVTVVMFDFMSYWNEYPLALVFLQNENVKTLPIGLQNLMETAKFATDWGAMFAGMVIVMLPTIALYCIVQKRLTQGISMGGLKG